MGGALLGINNDFTLMFLFQICGFLFVVFLPSKILFGSKFQFCSLVTLWSHQFCLVSNLFIMSNPRDGLGVFAPFLKSGNAAYKRLTKSEKIGAFPWQILHFVHGGLNIFRYSHDQFKRSSSRKWLAFLRPSSTVELSLAQNKLHLQRLVSAVSGCADTMFWAPDRNAICSSWCQLGALPDHKRPKNWKGATHLKSKLFYWQFIDYGKTVSCTELSVLYWCYILTKCCFFHICFSFLFFGKPVLVNDAEPETTVRRCSWC